MPAWVRNESGCSGPRWRRVRVRREVAYARNYPPAVPALAITMNTPGAFVHWSIFNISVANLVLIGVMVVIFGAALLLPFPRGERVEAAGVGDGAAAAEPVDPATARMWTYR